VLSLPLTTVMRIRQTLAAGWGDTRKTLQHPLFWLLDVGAGGAVAFMWQSVATGFIFAIVVLVSLFIGHTTLIPIRQQWQTLRTIAPAAISLVVLTALVVGVIATAVVATTWPQERTASSTLGEISRLQRELEAANARAQGSEQAQGTANQSASNPGPTADSASKDDMLRFLDLSVVPASMALADLGELVVKLERDELVARAFGIVSAQQNAYNAMFNDYTSKPFTEDLMVTGFCNFFESYFSAFRWVHWIGRRYNFDFGSPTYADWKTDNTNFLNDLRDLMRDARFARIRQQCANETTMSELMNANPP
jgi:hypothetical protein